MRVSTIAAVLVAAALAGCGTTPSPPKVEVHEVMVAVPVPCGVKVKKPAGQVARSKEDLGKMLAAAPNVTEKARIVSDQLLIWLGYGPQLEAALDGCQKIPQPPTDKVVK